VRVTSGRTRRPVLPDQRLAPAGRERAETLTKGTRAIVTGKLRNRSWQTDGGEQRTVTEIEADELGPSPKWATAKVERANRAGAGDKGGQFNDGPPF
jgi:single-strand DNA-binding protein